MMKETYGLRNDMMVRFIIIIIIIIIIMMTISVFAFKDIRMLLQAPIQEHLEHARYKAEKVREKEVPATQLVKPPSDVGLLGDL